MMRMLRVVVVAVLMASGLVGCGPEVVAVMALTGEVAAVAAPVVGMVWMVKSIERVSLDSEKTRLEIEALQDGRLEHISIDLTEDELRQIQISRRVRLGNREYRVD